MPRRDIQKKKENGRETAEMQGDTLPQKVRAPSYSRKEKKKSGRENRPPCETLMRKDPQQHRKEDRVKKKDGDDVK